MLKVSFRWVFALFLIFIFKEVCWGKLLLFPNDEEKHAWTNDAFHVRCLSPNGNRINWDGPGLAGKGRIVVENSATENASVLIFYRVQTIDSGIYTCYSDSEKVHFSLQVYEKLRFKDTKRNQVFEENSQAVLRCEVIGEPQAYTTWYIRGHQIKNNNHFEILADGLLIKGVHIADSGIYTCKSFQYTQQISHTEERQIILSVEHSPRLLDSESSSIRRSYLGEEIFLECRILAFPSAIFTWTHNRTRIMNVRVEETADMSTIKIVLDSYNDFGIYTCIATNRLGRISKEYHVVRVLRPMPPADFQCPSWTNGNSLLMEISRGTLEHEDAENPKFAAERLPSKYRVEFRLANSLYSTVWEYTDFDLRTDSIFVLSELEADKKYEVRVASVNELGVVSPFLQSKICDTADSNDSIALLVLILAVSLFACSCICIFSLHFLKRNSD